MARTKVINPDVLDVLRGINWEGNQLYLPQRQLDRKLYLAVNDVLESFGGKWKGGKTKAHIFEADDAQSELEAAIETGSYISATDLRQIYGEFETPNDLADKVIAKARIAADHSVLEPSAGSGQLVRACGRAGAGIVDAVEIQEKHAKSLLACSSAVLIQDFLTLDPSGMDGGYDRIVMNPPFGKQADIDHVLHAYDCLASGGRLVAIMSPGWTFRENRKSNDFRAFVAGNDGQWTANPEGAFSVSGTNVSSIMLVIDR